MTVPRPILFGEILFDHFPDGTTALGGAPLNVAAHLAGLGERPILVSRVGLDAEGDRARAELERRGVDLRAVQLDGERPTGAVRVDLDGGEPRFEILEHRAWDGIVAGDAVDSLRGVSIALLYHGVLAAREPRSLDALLALREVARAPCFVDVNLRPPWTPVERALALGQAVAWLKVNASELATLTGSQVADDGPGLEIAARRLLEVTRARRLIVTLGERGARLFAAGEPPVAAAAPVRPAGASGDTVGAGDAFSAVLLFGALREWPAPVALARAAELAAGVCTLRGALPPGEPWYREFLRRWETT